MAQREGEQTCCIVLTRPYAWRKRLPGVILAGDCKRDLLLPACPSDYAACFCWLPILKLYLILRGLSGGIHRCRGKLTVYLQLLQSFPLKSFLSKKYMNCCREKQVVSDGMMFAVGEAQFTQLFKEFANYTLFTHHAQRTHTKKSKKKAQ